MGMYDNLIVSEEIQLPDFEGQKQSEIIWQTKDLNCFLDTYKINKDGKLLRKRKEYEDQSRENLEEKARERGYDSFQEMLEEDSLKAFRLGDRQVKNEWWEETRHTIDIEFYASSTYDNLDKRHEYKAVFRDGVLQNLSLIEKR